MDARDQAKQRCMTSARHAADWCSVMIAQLCQCGLQQNEVSQLLMKCDVASGHQKSFRIPQVPAISRRRLKGYVPGGKISLQEDAFRQTIVKTVRLFILKPDGIGDLCLQQGAYGSWRRSLERPTCLFVFVQFWWRSRARSFLKLRSSNCPPQANERPLTYSLEISSIVCRYGSS